MSTSRSLIGELKESAFLIFGLVALMWVIQLLDVVLPGRLTTWGILPRSLLGLRGLIFAPILHNGWYHVIANTLPFIVLSFLVMLYGQGVYFRVFVFVAVVGGALTWLVGRPAYHVGASGVIMGLLGFLLARGWYERSLTSVLVALIAIIFYGGSLWGLLPLVPWVSWKMHLFGFVAGIAAARIAAIGGAMHGG